MIRSFRDASTARLFADEDVPRFRGIERQARRKLLLLDGAGALSDLRHPPGNRLEALKGEPPRRAFRSASNNQWRICFVWRDGGAELGRDRGLSLAHDPEERERASETDYH